MVVTYSMLRFKNKCNMFLTAEGCKVFYPMFSNKFNMFLTAEGCNVSFAMFSNKFNMFLTAEGCTRIPLWILLKERVTRKYNNTPFKSAYMWIPSSPCLTQRW